MSNLLEKLEIHKTLNPKLWDNMTLMSDVRQKLIDIAEAFKEFCDIDFDIVDIHLLGSNASFNWTDKSDIDLHIITNFENISPSEELVNALFTLEKSSFNSKYDIIVKGMEVEVYVEDMQSNVVSNGIYSVLNDKWIKKPQPLDDIEIPDVSDMVERWRNLINKTLSSGNIDKIETEENS